MPNPGNPRYDASLRDGSCCKLNGAQRLSHGHAKLMDGGNVIRAVSVLVILALLLAVPASAGERTTLRSALQRDIDQYLSTRGKAEHLSAISLSVSLHGQPGAINLTAGRTQYGNRGALVTPNSLWQTGSQTKGFTAAAILQLEAEGKLYLDQTVGKWLPQYAAWKGVTIRRLLNMTSGIPTYDELPQWQTAFTKNPKRTWTIPELIAYVDPKTNSHAPPPTTGYSYSNTNYLLAELIIERATGQSYATVIEQRFFEPLGMRRTYYSGTQYPADVLDRMVSGYFFTREPGAEPLEPLFGTDTRNNSVSWLRAGGGIVSTPEDLTRWVRALYAGPLLAPKQRAELLSIVSFKTGKPIATTSRSDPMGFGLGVVQQTVPGIKGPIWGYEGDTFGYRVVYNYFPTLDAVFAFGLNSNPGSESQVGKLTVAIYKTLVNPRPK